MQPRAASTGTPSSKTSRPATTPSPAQRPAISRSGYPISTRTLLSPPTGPTSRPSWTPSETLSPCFRPARPRCPC